MLLDGAEFADERKRAQSLPRVTVSSREKGDLIMLGIGGFHPARWVHDACRLEGVCDDMKTVAGLFWPIPLRCRRTGGRRTRQLNTEIALADRDTGEILATMKVRRNTHRQGARMQNGIRPRIRSTPASRWSWSRGRSIWPAGQVLSPAVSRKSTPALHDAGADARGAGSAWWTTVAAFQTRNPMHRSHEYLAKVAIEVCDGVLIHSLLAT